MNTRGLSLSVLGVFLSVYGARADTSLSPSPFLPLSGPVATAPVETGPQLELDGVMETSQGKYFSIYDPVKKSARWMRLREIGPGFRLIEYHIADGVDQVVIEIQGKTRTLALKRSKARSLLPASRPAEFISGTIASPTIMGIPENELLPQEKARLQMVASQVMMRLTHQREIDEAAKEASLGSSAENTGPQPILRQNPDQKKNGK